MSTVYDRARKASRGIHYADRMTNRILGAVTILLLLLGFGFVILEAFQIKLFVRDNILHFIELIARYLAAASILFGIYFNWYKYRGDKFSPLARGIQRVLKKSAAVPDLHHFQKDNPLMMRYINEEDLISEFNRLARFAGSFYYANNISLTLRFTKFREWHRANPKTIIQFFDEFNVLVGYIFSLVLYDETGSDGRKHFEKAWEEFGIQQSGIKKKDEGRSTLLLSQGIALHPKYNDNADVLQQFLHAFYRQMAEFMYCEEALIDQTIIYMEPVSPGNNWLFEVLGFTISDRKSLSGRAFYVIDFGVKNDPDPRTYETKVNILYYIEKLSKENLNQETDTDVDVKW